MGNYNNVEVFSNNFGHAPRIHTWSATIQHEIGKYLIDPDNVPADWRDPRPLWRRFHLLRTVLAVVAVAVNAAALALL